MDLAALVKANSPGFLNLAFPLCHLAQLVGLWLLTTPQAHARAKTLRTRGMALRWTAVLSFVGVYAAYPLWASSYPVAMGLSSVADALVGVLWGVYLAGIARILSHRWLRVGGWFVSIGSALCGGAFAWVFYFMMFTRRYWETILWTTLTGWSVVGFGCTALLSLLWRRLRRELRAVRDPAPSPTMSG